jgi:hypothetical protein
MSQRTYFKHHAPMQTTRLDVGKEIPEEMEIEAYYELGGPNYWSGGTTKRGLWLSFWPVARSTGSVVRSIPDDRARRIMLEELARNSRKRGETWAAIIDANIDQIAEASIAQDWERVKHILTHPQERDAA